MMQCSNRKRALLGSTNDSNTNNNSCDDEAAAAKRPRNAGTATSQSLWLVEQQTTTRRISCVATPGGPPSNGSQPLEEEEVADVPLGNHDTDHARISVSPFVAARPSALKPTTTTQQQASAFALSSCRSTHKEMPSQPPNLQPSFRSLQENDATILDKEDIYHNATKRTVTSSIDRLVRLLQLLLVPTILLVSSSGRPPPTNHGTVVWWRRRGHARSKQGPATKGTAVSSHGPPVTLRDVLYASQGGVHVAMAPAFFGFYGYYGMLDALLASTNHHLSFQSAVGASAGAMAAILLGAGIAPQEAMEFCANMTVWDFADGPGWGSVFRGNLFERLMRHFLQLHRKTTFDDLEIPVAVTAFDIQTLTGRILNQGDLARAARASATFPGLFQPVGWTNATHDYLLIDGGITDPAGLQALSSFASSGTILNLCAGSFLSHPPPYVPNHDVVSISIKGLPQPGPWAMHKGPLAFEAARSALELSLDVPLSKVADYEEGKHAHYSLTVRA